MPTVTLESTTISPRRIALGQQGEFALRGFDGPVEARFFLTHDGIRYLTPLNQSAADSVRVYPEAPGAYTVSAAWQLPSGESGWAETSLAFPFFGKAAFRASTSAVSMALARRKAPRGASEARRVQPLARSPWILAKWWRRYASSSAGVERPSLQGSTA